MNCRIVAGLIVAVVISSAARADLKSLFGATTKSKSHVEMLADIKSMNEGRTLEDKAGRCKALIDYYLAKTTEKYQFEFQSLSQNITYTGVAKMALPPFDESFSTELRLLADCKFVRYVVPVATIAPEGLRYGGDDCSECGPIFSSMLQGHVNQKISEGRYAVSNSKRVRAFMSTDPATRVIGDDTYLLKTEGSYPRTGWANIFAIYAGDHNQTMLDGFEKAVPEIIDIGTEGITAAYCRFSQFLKYLEAVRPNKMICGFQDYTSTSESPIPLRSFICVSKGNAAAIAEQFTNFDYNCSGKGK